MSEDRRVVTDARVRIHARLSRAHIRSRIVRGGRARELPPWECDRGRPDWRGSSPPAGPADHSLSGSEFRQCCRWKHSCGCLSGLSCDRIAAIADAEIEILFMPGVDRHRPTADVGDGFRCVAQRGTGSKSRDDLARRVTDEWNVALLLGEAALCWAADCSCVGCGRSGHACGSHLAAFASAQVVARGRRSCICECPTRRRCGRREDALFRGGRGSAMGDDRGRVRRLRSFARRNRNRTRRGDLGYRESCCRR